MLYYMVEERRYNYDQLQADMYHHLSEAFRLCEMQVFHRESQNVDFLLELYTTYKR